MRHAIGLAVIACVTIAAGCESPEANRTRGGGSGQPFHVSSADLLNKEQELLGSRYVTRAEVLEACDLVARGEVFPLVSDVRPLEQAEALHERVERGEVTGRAALRVASP